MFCDDTKKYRTKIITQPFFFFFCRIQEWIEAQKYLIWDIKRRSKTIRNKINKTNKAKKKKHIDIFAYGHRVTLYTHQYTYVIVTIIIIIMIITNKTYEIDCLILDFFKANALVVCHFFALRMMTNQLNICVNIYSPQERLQTTLIELIMIIYVTLKITNSSTEI